MPLPTPPLLRTDPLHRRSSAHKLVVGLVLCAFVAAGVSLLAGARPASAQSPTLTIDTWVPRCGTVGGAVRLGIGGSTNLASVSAIVNAPSGASVSKGSATPASGRWSMSLPFTPQETGDYVVTATAGSLSVTGYFSVPCQNPTLEYNPTCFPVGYSGTVTMTARHFVPFGTGYMNYDVNGSEAQNAIRIPNDGHGDFSATFKVTPSNRDHPGEGTDANRTLVASATWSPCPPGTTIPPTTTSTSTTVVIDTSTTTSTTARPGTTTTTTSPTVTIPIPPPTPGVSLVVDPPIGPPGFVTMAHGSGFPAGPVTLVWSPGIGATSAIAAADGTFTVQVLILPHDFLGPRALVASGGGASAGAAFLVVPASVQPSGKDVTQINRSRRFLNRSG